VPLAAGATRARLTFFPPGLRQATHRHDRTHISIIIAGAMRETSGGREQVGTVSAVILRPEEVSHQVQFGPRGALTLAVDVNDPFERTCMSGWVHAQLTPSQRTLLQWVLAEGGTRDGDVSDCLDDLIAGIESETLRGSPPAWLIRAHDELVSTPAGTRIDALARAVGVHRAHFARAFQHWFNAPPSLFRRRAMLSHAIAAMASGESIASASSIAGFADQSHLNRAMRGAIGVTPRRLLRRA
jgi:AraC family transcriptional regulator